MPETAVFPVDLDVAVVRSHDEFLEKLRKPMESDALFAPFRFLLDGSAAHRILAAKEAAAQTLDPSLQGYRVQFVGENSSEAARLVDRSLQLYRELLGIESEAIYKLIEYAAAEKASSLAVQLNKTSVRASRAQFEPSEADADESTIDELNKIQEASRRLLLSLHGRRGSPLNYAERAKLLTELLAENIMLLEERLRAVRRGFGTFFGVELDPVPLWSDRPDAFPDLIMYSRRAVTRVDKLMQRSVVRTVQFLVGRDGLYLPTTLHSNPVVIENLQDLLNLMTRNESVDSVIKFELRESDLPGRGRKRLLDVVAMPVFLISARPLLDNLFTLNNALQPPETLGDRASVASINQAWHSVRLQALRDFEFDIELWAPSQLKFDGLHSDLPPIRFKSSYWAPAMSLPSEVVPSGQGTELGNANPLGEWLLRFVDNTSFGLYRQHLHQLGLLLSGNQDFGENPLAMHDILLSIKYAAEDEGL